MSLSNNKYWLLIIAFFLALLIRWHTTSLKTQTSIISLPIEYVNLPEDISLSNLPLKNRFKIVAKGYDIIKLKLSSYHVKYDASALDKEEQKLDKRYYLFDDLSDYNIGFLEPVFDDIQVDTPAIITSSVGVELTFANNESKQLFNDRMYKLIQEEVSIRGPENLVRSTPRIKTQPLTASMLSKSKISLSLIAPSKQIELLSTLVDLIRLDEQSITKVITKIRIDSEPGYDFFPRELTVRIRGITSLVNSVTNRDISAELVLSEQKDNEIPVSIKTPPDIEVLDYSPQKVSTKNK